MRAEIRGRIEKFKNGELPKGYKKTRRRTIPIDWEIKSLNELVERISKPVEVDPNVHYKQIGIRSHGKGIFYKDEVTGYELGNKAVFWIEPDCFIVNIVFAWEMAVARTTSAETGMIASHRFPMYRPIVNKMDVDYLTYFFKSPFGKSLLELASPGGAGRNKTLGQKEFMALTVPIPKTISEQKKIATILSTWDKAIELKERLIEHKKEQKRGLMQALLTGKVRLPGFEGEWKKVKLGAITEYKSSNISISSLEDYVGEGIYPIYSANGVYKYVDFYSSDKGYISIIKDGAGAGRLYLCDKESSVIGTMGYLFNKNDVTLEYLFYRLNMVDFTKHIKGSTIPHVYFKDYKNEIILIPSIAEQKSISIILRTSDREINLLEKELSALKIQKKGLIQLLLTGIVRVKN